MSHKVAWLPAHPAEGTVSMQRYWQSLERERSRLGAAGVEASAALPWVDFSPRATRLRRFWSKRIVYPWRVRHLPRADVYHLLDHSYAHLLAHLPSDARIVATVHDLAPLDAPHRLSRAQVNRFRATVAGLKRADRLVAISRYTAGRLAAELGIREDRITVLPLAVDHAVFAPGAGEARDGPYVLSVGSDEPRKNLEALIPCLARAAAGISGLSLVRVGEWLPPALRRGLAAVLGGRVHELGCVDDHRLAGLYAGALALVMPSRLEGFGLPVLEAMACGCPVVCSDATSLPEVGGDAVLYFPACDGAIAGDHLAALAADPRRRADLIARGKARAAGFTWSGHADALAGIYRELAGS